MVSGESQGIIPRMPSGSQSRCWGGEAEPHGWLVLRTGHLISHLMASASLPQGPGNEEGLVGTPSIVMMTAGWQNHLGHSSPCKDLVAPPHPLQDSVALTAAEWWV